MKYDQRHEIIVEPYAPTVKCIISEGALKSVSFLPTFISKKTAQPEILAASDERFGQVVKYLDEISKDQGLGTTYTVKGDEVFVS